MKNAIIILVVIAIAATFVNDVGRYAKARYDLSNVTKETALQAARDSSASRDANAMKAARFAADRNVTVYAFDQDDQKVRVFAQMPVEGTWLLGPMMAVFSGEDLTTPYHVRTDYTAFFQ